MTSQMRAGPTDPTHWKTKQGGTTSRIHRHAHAQELFRAGVMDVEADSWFEMGFRCVNAVKGTDIFMGVKLKTDTSFQGLMDVRCDSAHLTVEMSDVSTNGDEPYVVVDTVGAEVCDVISDQTLGVQ